MSDRQSSASVRTCDVNGCERKHSARGFCQRHYNRARRTGTLQLLPKVTPRERFDAKVMPTPDGCNLWAASVNSYGYGMFRVDGKMVTAHRYAFERANGPIPEGMFIDHICRVRSCVNPAHLRVVTPRQNVLENSQSLPAKNAAKTHCQQGHPFSGTNLQVTKTGKRVCITCKRRLDARQTWKRSIQRWFVRQMQQDAERAA